MKRAAVYCRISRDREGARLGVDRQEADCRELASRNGFSVVQVYVDNDLSAYSGKPRPGYRQLLADIGRGEIDVVLAWHTDRLHRSPVELEEYISICEQHGAPTHTVKAGPIDLATPSGRLVARQLGAVARYEVEHSIERQQSAKLQAATDGRWKGGRRPYGYAADGITLVEDEAAIVRELNARVLAGASLRGLAADLNRRGLSTSTGAPWRQDAVRRILMRPRNAGLMEHRGEVIGDANWPALVPEEEWRAVVGLLTDPERRTAMTSVRRWLLSGIATCGPCGGPTYVTMMNVRSSPQPAYTCKDGRHIARTATLVDEVVERVTVARLSRPDAIELLQPRPGGPDVGQLRVRAAGLRQRLDGLALEYADGNIDARQLRQGTDRLRGQLATVNRQIGEAARGSVLSGLVDATDVQQVWAGLDLERRRAVISALMTVTINTTTKGRPAGWRKGDPYFDPASIDIQWLQ